MTLPLEASRKAIRDAVARRLVLPLRFSRFRPGFSSAAAGHRDGIARRREAALLDPGARALRAIASLRAAVSDAGEAVPFWRERFRRGGFDWRAPFTLEEFASAVPPLERAEVIDAGDAILSQRVDRARLIADATGGSTGEPLRFRVDPYERGFLDAGAEWHYLSLGCAPGRRTGLLYGGEVDPLVRPSLARRARNWATNVAAFPCFRLDASHLEAVHRAFERFRPALVVAYASAARALAIHLRESGRSASYPTTALVTAAEKLDADSRRIVDSVFAARAFERYGSREAGLVACETRETGDGALRVDLEHVLVEPAGTADAARRAPILVSQLRARAMPLFRYRVGDVGRFDPLRRDGRTGVFTSLAEVAGRDMDFLVRKDGGLVHPVELPHFFKDLPVREYQAAQGEDGSVRISLVAAPEFTPEHGERIRAVIERNLGGFPVVVCAVERIERTEAAKLRPVVSALARARGGLLPAAASRGKR